MSATELSFIEIVIEQTGAAQPGNALQVCQSLLSMARQRRSECKMPDCREGCKLPHTLEVAMALLGVKRTRLYELMSAHLITYFDTDYGRRIRHDEIDRYLESHQIERTPTDTGE